jgi:hypothetical protein
MADATITAVQQGAYELALTANTVVTVDVTSNQASTKNKVQVMVHSGTAPVYAKFTNGTTITLKDPTATIILPNQWVDLTSVLGNPNTATFTVALISSAAAVVSVYRSGN